MKSKSILTYWKVGFCPWQPVYDKTISMICLQVTHLTLVIEYDWNFSNERQNWQKCALPS